MLLETILFSNVSAGAGIAGADPAQSFSASAATHVQERQKNLNGAHPNQTLSPKGGCVGTGSRRQLPAAQQCMMHTQSQTCL